MNIDEAIPSTFSYQTLVLPDAVVNNLPTTTKHVSAYNYNVQNWEKTYEIADDFIKRCKKIEQRIPIRRTSYSLL